MSREQLNVLLPRDLKAALRATAEMRGLDMTTLVILALEQYLRGAIVRCQQERVQ